MEALTVPDTHPDNPSVPFELQVMVFVPTEWCYLPTDLKPRSFVSQLGSAEQLALTWALQEAQKYPRDSKFLSEAQEFITNGDIPSALHMLGLILSGRFEMTELTTPS